LRALGGVDEAYSPAYVEDLDLGYRAWQRGWATVFVANAVVEHRHRATTSRFYTEEQLDRVLEMNYLRFLCRAVADRRLFRRLWAEAVERLWRRKHPALREAASIAWATRMPGKPRCSEEEFLRRADGSVEFRREGQAAHSNLP